MARTSPRCTGSDRRDGGPRPLGPVRVYRNKTPSQLLLLCYDGGGTRGPSWDGVPMAKGRKHQIRHDEIVRQFAERLREQRRARGLTQAELAQRAEVTETYV